MDAIHLQQLMILWKNNATNKRFCKKIIDRWGVDLDNE